MPRLSRNRTLKLSSKERTDFDRMLLGSVSPGTSVIDRVINQEIMSALPNLPDSFVDLLFLDPPYNLDKKFNSSRFAQADQETYRQWMETWLKPMIRLLKRTASVYICGDWRSAAAIQRLGEHYFIIRNRITFEREKGRSSRSNWKNASEDIWFATVGDDYYFNPDAVKIKRRVLAPYRTAGKPKDWQETVAGNFRLTGASNLWTDITIPFWSMPENTPHPTQKPEKLLAKIIMASTRPGDVIFDPFAGSGTTGAAAAKLNRRFVLIERERDYCLYALKRLALARINPEIQGYTDGCFWDRNAKPFKQGGTKNETKKKEEDQR